MIDAKSAVALGIFLVIILFGGTIWDSFDNWIQTAISGPEYCFREIDIVSYSIKFSDFGISETYKKGDELCFRTKDFSQVENISQQIQDRKYQERLAEIEADSIFWNQTFPKLFIFGLIAIVVIIIIISLSNRNSRGNY